MAKWGEWGFGSFGPSDTGKTRRLARKRRLTNEASFL